MKKNERTFLGNPISGDDYQIINSFLGMIEGTYRRDLKSAQQLWDGVGRVFDKHPKPGEPFMTSVNRILQELRAIPQQTRAVLRKHYGVNPQRWGSKARQVAKPVHPTPVKPMCVKVKVKSAPQAPVAGNITPSVAMKTAFYASWEWRTMRYQVLAQEGRSCSCCGARPGDMTEAGEPVRIVVDHIKPLSKYWHLRLHRPNLAVLCDSCNMGKGNWDETDWRLAS